MDLGDFSAAVKPIVALFMFVFFWRRSTAESILLSDVSMSDDFIHVRIRREKGYLAAARDLFMQRVDIALHQWHHPFDVMKRWIGYAIERKFHTLFGLSAAEIAGAWAWLSERYGSIAWAPHSGRIGGAAACLVAGVTIELVMTRGNWHSSQSVLPYARQVVDSPYSAVFFSVSVSAAFVVQTRNLIQLLSGANRKL